MQTCKDFFLQQMLPTTSSMDRELWFRTSESAQRFVEIMKSYSQEIIDECIDIFPNWEKMAEEIIEEFLDDVQEKVSYRQQQEIIKSIENIGKEIEEEIRNIYYQI